MEQINLLVVCANAFVVVLALLSALALLMRGLITLFPPPRPAESPSAPVAAAIQAAVQAAHPGARVTRIETLH